MSTSWLLRLRLPLITMTLLLGWDVCLGGEMADSVCAAHQSCISGRFDGVVTTHPYQVASQNKRTTSEPTLDLVPDSVSSGSAIISGNSITVGSGGIVVKLSLRVSGWGAVGDSQLSNVTAKIDGVGYCSGMGEAIVPLGYPVNPLFDCSISEGLGCPADGNTCGVGAFVPDKACSISSRYCNNSIPCDAGLEGFCIDNPSYVFSGMNVFKAVQFSGLDYVWSTLTFDPNGPIDMGQSALFGTLFVEIPSNASGTYTLGFDTGVDSIFGSSLSGTFDGMGVFHPFGTIHPARIIVGSPSGGNGDFNGDRLLDLRDVQRFQRCFTSAGIMVESGCYAGDLDNDNDVDLSDYADFSILIE